MPSSDLAQRILRAAEKAIDESFDFEASHFEVEARAAAVAMLAALAATGGEWTEDELAALAEEIEEA